MYVKRGVRVLLIVIAEGLAGSPALADSVAADLVTDNNAYAFTTGSATSAFFLYAQFSTFANTASSATGETSNGTTYNIATPIPVAQGIGMDFGPQKYPDSGFNILGVNNIQKPDQPSGSQVASDTISFFTGGSIGAFGSVLARTKPSSIPFLPPQVGYELHAETQGNLSGRAASITYDPAQLTAPPSGYYPLNYVDSNGVQEDAYTLSASLSQTNPGDFEAVEFFAVDSRFGPTYPSNLGDPTNDLWTLTITADEPLVSPSDLTVTFQINPLATTAGGGSANILTDANGNPLSPGGVEGAILSNITVSDGVATLAPTDPFPLGTRYYVDQTITYGVADGAALTSVPEPASIWLLLTSLLGSTAWAIGGRFRTDRRPR